MSQGFGAPAPPVPPARTRPATVTVAGVLLLLVALFAVVFLAATLVTLGDVQAAADLAYGTDEDAATITVSTLIPAVGYVIIGLLLALLTIFINAGRNGARITAWVIGGLGVCCGGLFMLSAAFQSAFEEALQGEPGTEEFEAFQDAYQEQVPGWLDPVVLASSAIGVLALIVALILLALPGSNAFFRKRPEEVFEPPPAYPPPQSPSAFQPPPPPSAGQQPPPPGPPPGT
jgi:hypothetical protein